MKNKYVLILVSILLLGAQSAEAKFCIGCGAELPDTANFCSSCSSPQPQVSSLSAPKKLNYREHILNMFQFIDDFERSFNDMKYVDILGKMPDIRIRFQNAGVEYRKFENIIPQELKVLANLFAKKFQIFEGLNGALKDLRLDPGYKEAIARGGMYEISLINKFISIYRKPITIDDNFRKLIKDNYASIANKCKRYHVTAKYLKIGETKASQGSAIMVLGINNNKANVLLMSPSKSYSVVEGHISLDSLANRTTWVRENEFFFLNKIDE